MAKLTFDSVLSESIYKNRNALYEQIPQEGVIGRVNERNEMVMELAPLLMDSPVSSVFVYGTPGTGKTTLTLEICEELKKEAKKRNVPLKSVYINCSENRTPFAVLSELLTRLSNTESPKTGLSTKKVLSKVKYLLNSQKMNVLLVLDEIDYVLRESGDDLLYILSRINGDGKTKLSSLMVSNDLKVYDYLSPRTHSSFGRVKIIFSPYSYSELKGILAARVKRAFYPKTVSKAVIEKIAQVESERGGDARKALELLDSCAKIALSKGRKTVALDLVNEAEKNLERDSLVKTLMGLTKHQKLLFLTLLKSKKEISGPDVYNRYLSECKSYKLRPLSERRIRSFLIYFKELGLISSEIGWVQNLGKKGRKITLNFDDAIKSKIRKKVRDSI